jgi:hypothetical protein
MNTRAGRGKHGCQGGDAGEGNRWSRANSEARLAHQRNCKRVETCAFGVLDTVRAAVGMTKTIGGAVEASPACI